MILISCHHPTPSPRLKIILQLQFTQVVELRIPHPSDLQGQVQLLSGNARHRLISGVGKLGHFEKSGPLKIVEKRE